MKSMENHIIAEYKSRLVARVPHVETGIAYDIASYAHDGVVRNVYDAQQDDVTQHPYIMHPLRVANFLADFGVEDPDVIDAALLHDTVEDAAPRLLEYMGSGVNNNLEADRADALGVILSACNVRVMRIVEELSNPIPDPSLNREQRLAQYVEHVQNISIPEARLIKFADFCDNAGNLLTVHPRSRAYFARRYSPLIPIHHRNIFGYPDIDPHITHSGKKIMYRLFKSIESDLRSYS